MHHYNVEILNLFDAELQLINTEPVIKNKFKKLLSELKKFKVKTVLVLEMIVKSSIQVLNLLLVIQTLVNILIHASEHYEKNKNYASEDWNVLDVISKHSIKIFEC